MALYIVGSVRINEEYYLKYLRDIKDLIKGSNNIVLRDVFTTDVEFDEWINAADVVVLPYKQIWSSSVLARAKLFDKPVIARNVGGLNEQIGNTDILFNTDLELEKIIQNFENVVNSSQ
jgi:glycosyltransferase involved in cell wall biosynthesis